MGESAPEERRTVRLDMQTRYEEAIGLVGQEEADKLWEENRLSSEESWPGKWATAMEIIERLRATAADQ